MKCTHSRPNLDGHNVFLNKILKLLCSDLKKYCNVCKRSFGGILYKHRKTLLGALEITANLYCNCVQLYWEGCVISSIYLR